MKKNITFIIFIIVIIVITTTIYATEMESPGFRIQGGNVNIGAQDESSESYNLSTTLGQLAAGEFQAKGYVVRAGFQYIHSIIPFQFSISNTDLKFGRLNPNTPSTVSTDLTVSFGSAGEYQVTAIEEGSLRTQTGLFIPDTECDGGINQCHPIEAKQWISNVKYGFGYNLSGDDIPADFSSPNHFRPFPDRQRGEHSAVVMQNTNVGKKRQAKMLLKANIPSEQQVGSYSTVINFVATPSF